MLADGLDAGAAANVAACVAAGLAAAAPGWAGQVLRDAAGWRTVASSHLPIAVLRADAVALRGLVHQLGRRAADPGANGGCVSLFPAYARQMHDAAGYWQQHALCVHADEPMLGVGLHGPARWVRRWCGSLPLFR